MNIKIKGVNFEDFVNYKKPSMFIAFPFCSFKCEKDCGKQCCQNSELVKSNIIEIDIDDIVNKYISNPITSSIVIGGLEPFDSFTDLINLIVAFRRKTEDDIVIYTGYTKEEIKTNSFTIYNHNLNIKKDGYNILKSFSNIIIKFGRFIPNQEPHYDKILGVNLASKNQFGEKIS